MRSRRVTLAVTVFALLAACAAPTPTPTRVPAASATQQPVTATHPPTLTPVPPTVTQSPTVTPSAYATSLPTATPEPSATLTLSPSPTASATPAPTATFAPLGPATLGAVQQFELVGHNALGSVGWWGALALHGHYAYVGSYRQTQVAIVDIGDPANPRQLPGLELGPRSQPIELRTLSDLNLLVISDSVNNRLLTYDLADPERPALLADYALPEEPHEFYLWRDAQRVLAWVSLFYHHPPSLVVIDLTDPRDPVEVGRWSAADDGVAGDLHSISVSADGRSAYASMWKGGTVVLAIDLPKISALRAPGQRPGITFVNVHSSVSMRDPRYLLLAQEISTCPFAGMRIIDISDPARPVAVSHMLLPENACTGIPAGGTYSVHNPLVVGDLVLASWYAGGVQAWDVSDPASPRRVGQYVPTGEGSGGQNLWGSTYPVAMFSYPIVRDGLIYVSDGQTGLHILRYTGPGREAIDSGAHVEGNVTLLDK